MVESRSGEIPISLPHIDSRRSFECFVKADYIVDICLNYFDALGREGPFPCTLRVSSDSTVFPRLIAQKLGNNSATLTTSRTDNNNAFVRELETSRWRL
ncbi:uncharacterized protein N7500_000986 [Penicillium coprophilum]|uniref:uncharacterized protein n=1 Tax=Penicillium coprophilum TaxID=36646 RepID=UPI002397016D|nr:uncharacterized protein N7500_000986 [Penicillium coprophilum]KAJ5178287.1 hypothetical protein N7500_000986 [Penicillium coprophilum]